MVTERTTNTGQDPVIIARSALELAFAILNRLAAKDLITKDDLAHIHAAAFPAAGSGPKADLDALTDHIKVRLSALDEIIGTV